MSKQRRWQIRGLENRDPTYRGKGILEVETEKQNMLKSMMETTFLRNKGISDVPKKSNRIIKIETFW